MKDHIVTFGDSHCYPIAGTCKQTSGSRGILLKDIPEGISGREAVFSIFGGRFCFEYTKEEWVKSGSGQYVVLDKVDFKEQKKIMKSL